MFGAPGCHHADVVVQRVEVEPQLRHARAEGLLACDLLEVGTRTGARPHVFAVIEHATGRIQILGATAHPTAE
jgi:hypothetical protein